MLQALAQLAGKMATRPPQGTKGAKLVSFNERSCGTKCAPAAVLEVEAR
jgi:hypothetical protein